MLRRILGEPLLHFLLLGVGLFALYAWLQPGGQRNEVIVVSPQRLAAIDDQFERLWQRPPSAPEREGLIESFVREEVLYREGLAMGLDRDDPVIRRRLAQKMMFLGDRAIPAAPTEAELEHWLAAHADDYREPELLSIQQVLLPPALGAEAAAQLRERLRRRPDGWRAAGTATLLPAEMSAASRREIETQFGRDFAGQLTTIAAGTWQGPVASGYGRHLVRVLARVPGSLPPLAQVRDRVLRDLLAERARQAQDDLYRTLRARYRVELAAPQRAGDEIAVAR